MMSLLAAAPVPIYWHLPVLIVVISLVYSATRFDRWGSIFYEAFRWGLRMAGFLICVAVVLYLLASFI
jgi:hypothetical protein